MKLFLFTTILAPTLAFPNIKLDSIAPILDPKLDPVAQNQTELFRTMARFAGASYCDRIFTTQVYDCAWSCGGEAKGTQLLVTSFDKVTTGAALVAIIHALKSIFVSFRGSDSWQDYVANANFWESVADWKYKLQEFLPKGLLPKDLKVHAGFELQYVRVRDPLLNTTLAAAKEHPSYQIVFVGHSLGGALATLGVVDFHDRYGFSDRLALYTFGCPRVGDQKWARYVNNLPFVSRLYRIHQRGDLVQHLPPRWLGYEHSLQMYQILDDKSIVKCDNEEGTGESPTCLNDWLDIRPTKHAEYFVRPRC